MILDILNHVIKYSVIYISICFCYIKIINIAKLNLPKRLTIIFLSLILSWIAFFMQKHIANYNILLIIYIFYSSLLSILTKTNFTKSLVVTLLSTGITYISSLISFFIIGGIFYSFTNLKLTETIVISFISIATFILIYSIFQIRRLKNGFSFLNGKNDNEFFYIILLTLCIIFLFMYFLVGYINEYLPKQSSNILIFIIFVFTIIIRRALILYHKQKLQLKALKDYEQELSETKQKLETALSEKRNLVQSNHEFYHRQKALSQKLDELMILQAHSANTEVSEEISDIIDRINKMSDEYKTKTHTLPNLEKCNIKSIDDMFSYMQYECYKNDIEFILKYNCDINHIINNNINESQLETLLGDFIRNSIIAINHSENSYRSIMVVFGIKDDAYELCVFDSGIPFEINTLINLGLQPASTHLDEGGTGSGFISTFETINSCNASFIINEITGTNYTKSLEIKFDNKHEYIIISDRSNEIKKLNVSNRNIILK